ncbi:MAG: DUF1080 domain-containing protein [Candidatus Hydrogenedentes bacterium]|nr:DUF1080 domain-containing protein [Candidatus Hydrogenedentota bacterium]
MKLRTVALLSLSMISMSAFAQDAAKPYLGRWALTIPGGAAGWLQITNENGFLDGSILWGGGSVVPVACVGTAEGRLFVLRLSDVQRKNEKGEVIKVQQVPEALFGSVEGDTINFERHELRRDGSGMDVSTFSGTRIPDLPPAPDLSKVTYGDPITLFNGQNLDGWQLTDPNQVNGWSAKDGLLINDPVQAEGQPHKSYGNLRTTQEFEDFTLECDVNVLPKGNSGIYLRGIYEVQVEDSYAKPVDSHHMGGVYSRITPLLPAEKPAGEWQHLDITLCDRHVTVKLNNILIIDNQPLLGCTGGALWSDESKPGPIYLQGDHTGVQYKDLVLKPIVK